MPTPIPSGEKSAVIALVNVVNPVEAMRLATVLVNYEDVLTMIGRQLSTFIQRNNYLIQVMACFTDANLVSVGIYNRKSGNNLTEPNAIINSNYAGIMTMSSNIGQLVILGNSFVNSVVLSSNVDVQYIYIGPGSTLNIADSSASGAIINKIILPFVRSTPSTLNTLKFGSTIGLVQVDAGSYYGGVANDDVTATCPDVVTSVVATENTNNSVLISWALPGSYLMINIFYKKANSNVWILATDSDGDFDGDTGFVFRTLESDTFYSFRISTVCTNGGIANAEITTQTVCCGSGTVLTQYVDCEITANIKTSPNPANTQTLRNGTVIPLEYPVGATLTIPYLADPAKYVFKTLVVDEANYQNFPFNVTTGVFNAAGTTLTTFIDGNVVTIRASIPQL